VIRQEQRVQALGARVSQAISAFNDLLAGLRTLQRRSYLQGRPPSVQIRVSGRL